MESHENQRFFVSIPHSGERVPDQVTWLQDLAEPTLMRDVDRFVDKLYQPAIAELGLELVQTPWHRYVVDLNRREDEYDLGAADGAPFEKGKHPKGLHWRVTTIGEELIKQPMSAELHQSLVESYYQPFHRQLHEKRQEFLDRFGVCYHLDLHSMPSKGTDLHPDPGEDRAEVVVSDYHGQSSTEEFKAIVIKAYQHAGFEVAYNWPYVGGGITQRYGKPDEGFNTIQIELNRKLYMDEQTKQLRPELTQSLQVKLTSALKEVAEQLKELLNG